VTISKFQQNAKITFFCKLYDAEEKLIIPSVRFIETKLFKNPLCTTGMCDLKIIKNHKMISVVGLHCQGTTKCSQRAHNAAYSKSHFLYRNSLSVCRMPFGGGEKNLVKWSKIGSCTVTACLVKLPLQGSSFWRRTEWQQSSNYLIHQISLHATSVTSQGPRPDPEIIILHLQKKLNRILQHVSEPYEQMTSRDTSSNGRSARASCMCRSEVLPG